MKNIKRIGFIILLLLVFFVSGCAVQGSMQGDDTLKVEGNVNKSSTPPPVSAWYFYKMNKAASNLSWAAAVRMAVISQRSRWDQYILQEAWQGDISSKYFNYDRNAKPYSYFDMIDKIKTSLEYYGGGTHGDKLVAGADDVYSNEFYLVLYEGVPIIVVRRDKTNYNNYWAVVIYAMPDATDGHEKISVWDPEHGWDYTCDLKGFCDDARYYDNDKNGQMAIWPNYGAAGNTPAGMW